TIDLTASTDPSITDLLTSVKTVFDLRVQLAGAKADLQCGVADDPSGKDVVDGAEVKFASSVQCSVISVSHSSLTSSAVAARVTRSSWSSGPGRFPILPRFFPYTDHHWLSRQIRHAVRSHISSPVSAASPTRNR